MFDKLGALLSEALETGVLPENNKDSDSISEVQAPSQEPLITIKKELPQNVKKAFAFISIPEDAGYSEAKKLYREKLMYYHPDRRNSNPVLQKVAKEKTERLLKEWALLEEWYQSSS